MASIGWLHLTDLHLGLSGQKWLWPTVREQFYEDLERLHAKSGPWDLVLFTGDLTQKGTKEEFDRLAETLGKLWDHLAKLGSKPALITVPGNHDLQRPKLNPTVRALRAWNDHPDLREEFWASADNDYRTVVREAFAAYEGFVKAHPLPADFAVRRGVLPGDRAISLERDGLKLALVGLNTAFLQLEGGDYLGKLGLDSRQLHAVCGDDPPEWLSAHHLALLLTHHPAAWLHPRALDGFKADIAPPGRFVAHLFGHMHEGSTTSFSMSGSSPQRAVQGPSLFGLETWGDGTQQRIHGYMVGRVTLDDTRGTFRLWPRQLRRSRAGAWRMTPDYNFELHEEAVVEEFRSRTVAVPTVGFTKLDRKSRTVRVARFMEAYQKALLGLFDQWDLTSVGITTTGDGGQPVRADFDEMYLPFRLEEGYDIDRTDRGVGLNVDALLARSRPLVIRGGAGTGKTTWVRWAFRALLRLKQAALPLPIILRDLARYWQPPVGADTASWTLETFLDEWVAKRVPGLEGVPLREVLAGLDGPRPVLLVDGWDEIGSAGDQLRSALLAFMERFPRVLVVATSRPYGVAKPSQSDGFETVDIQPLSNDEIQAFARHFFAFCYRYDSAETDRQVKKFYEDLTALPDAMRLARTTLLLTMMLMISRGKRLPDKRHELYRECIANFLTARPDMQEADGAVLARALWRPDDTEERLRVVAALAANVQQIGYQTASGRTVTLCTDDQMVAMLPPKFPRVIPLGITSDERRRQFIYWLAGPASILTERTDGKLAFAHLSFQEFLAAWHLNATLEGSERVATFRQRMSGPNWWETLLLWAALIEAVSPERLDGVVEHIASASPGGISLVGMLLADGLGHESFDPWLERFITTINAAWPAEMDRCLRAWAASRQVSRKLALNRALNTLTEHSDLNDLGEDELRRLAQRLQRVRRAQETLLGADARDVARTCHALGRVCLRLGVPRLPEAEAALRYAERILVMLDKALSPDLTAVRSDLALALAGLGEPRHLEEAESHLRAVLQVQETAEGVETPAVATTLEHLASVLQALSSPRQRDEAAFLLKRAIAIHELINGPDSFRAIERLRRRLDQIAAGVDAVPPTISTPIVSPPAATRTNPEVLVCGAASHAPRSDTAPTYPITILHLTDLHFGVFGHYWTASDENTEFQVSVPNRRGLLRGLVRDLRNQNINPDLMIVTGDLLDKAQADGVPLALAFLNGLVNELPLRRERVVLAPGNHDVIRGAAPDQRYAHFAEIWNSFYGKTRAPFAASAPPQGLVEHFDYVHDLGLEVVSFNSCEELAPEDKMEHGSIEVAQRDRAEEFLRAMRARRLVRIAAMHHHLASPVGIVRDDYSIMHDAAAIKRWLVQNHFQLALHGHQHVDWQEVTLRDGWGLAVVAGASAGVGNYGRKEWFLPLGYQVIVLDSSSRGRRIRREYDPASREWIAAGKGNAIQEIQFGEADPPVEAAPIMPTSKLAMLPTISSLTANGGTPPVDVLIVTAVKDEYDAVRLVETAAWPGDSWAEEQPDGVHRVSFRAFRARDDSPLHVAVTWATGMGGVATAAAVQSFIDRYHPRVLAMSGVCAGRRGDTNLGDVIVADRAWTYDFRAVTATYSPDGTRTERFQADITTYQVLARWRQAIETFQPNPTESAVWLATRPISYAHQLEWILDRLFDGESPASHPDRKARCPDWSRVLERHWKSLEADWFVSKTLALTPKGREHIEHLRLVLHPDGLPVAEPFRVRMGVIATGSNVMRDELIFDRLADAERKVLGLEMEAAALGAVAHIRDLPLVVMKGVMDHADLNKSDNFRLFAARTSAECVLAFLRLHMPG